MSTTSTSATEPKNHKPPANTKKRPRPQSPTSHQTAHISALFSNPTIASSLSLSGPAGKEGRKSGLAPPPDIVTNVQGSSAGAGSGEFHVYKAARRREYERLRHMETRKLADAADHDFIAKRDQVQKQDQEKTDRNKRRREKARARKQKPGAVSNGLGGDDVARPESESQPARPGAPTQSDNPDEPDNLSTTKPTTSGPETADAADSRTSTAETEPAVQPVADAQSMTVVIIDDTGF